MPASLSYTDRFGQTWRVRGVQTPHGAWTLAFASPGIRLVSTETLTSKPAELTLEGLKEVFCDAERVLESDGETWYVGYRRRTFGRRSTPQGELCTRFRSEAGEVRFSHAMLDFRHMATSDLREHLVTLLRRNGKAAPGGQGRDPQPSQV